MTKIYGISGKSDVIIDIPSANGKAHMRREFTRGCPNAGMNSRPATYTTSNPSEQAFIENSRLFGTVIKIWKEFKDETVAVTYENENGKPVDAKAAPQQKEYPDVTTKDGLIATLKALGAKAAVLSSDENMRRFIKNRKLSFPNYEL